MSIELITKGGKKIGRIADNINEDDIILVGGHSVTLSDAYDDEKIIKSFNKEVKKLKDESSK